jgi:hypothetical protein
VKIIRTFNDIILIITSNNNNNDSNNNNKCKKKHEKNVKQTIKRNTIVKNFNKITLQTHVYA